MGQKEMELYLILEEATMSLLGQMQEEHRLLEKKFGELKKFISKGSTERLRLQHVLSDIDQDIRWLEQLRLDVDHIEQKQWSLCSGDSALKELQKKLKSADDRKELLERILASSRNLDSNLSWLFMQKQFQDLNKEGYYYHAVYEYRRSQETA